MSNLYDDSYVKSFSFIITGFFIMSVGVKWAALPFLDLLLCVSMVQKTANLFIFMKEKYQEISTGEANSLQYIVRDHQEPMIIFFLLFGITQKS